VVEIHLSNVELVINSTVRTTHMDIFHPYLREAIRVGSNLKIEKAIGAGTRKLNF
jgi:hypothetical protein